ncbi:MAG: hypothetical protein BWY59_00664 [Verrucomicrobia bacterium ADurb.Bin345]|nr:MAG: hypothetical protein BWY59_00664 [Verrucomicrobia bacterium ADurb.Bin345]
MSGRDVCILLLAVAASVLPFAASPAAARDFVTVRSAYLGDGWFSYTMRMEPNPFFSTQITGIAGTAAFTNRIDANTPPEGWTESPDTSSFFWGKDNQFEEHALPLELTMMARSSSSGYRTQTNYFVMFVLWMHDWLPIPGILSANIAGYVRLPALVPCEPAESDGSPTELFSGYEIFPDPEVVESGPDFLSYFWPNTNTVVIEASYDLQSWSNVAQMVGHGGTSTWVAAQPLDELGSFFRVGLVAMRALSGISSSQDPIPPAAPGVFNRLAPEGLFVSGPDGKTTLLPAGEADKGLWMLPAPRVSPRSRTTRRRP